MIIWEAKLDDLYDCKVTQTDDYLGQLTMIDPFDRKLIDREVQLTFGARFGPDVADVAYWEELCVAALEK